MTGFQLTCGKCHLDLGSRACIMGILNVTPDSFSDGGAFNEYDAAVARGMRLAEQGAHILDIGGESTRPFSKPVSVQEEIDRVVPVINTLSKKISIPISIDTVKAPVARAALDAGAAIINDISAFEMDPDMADLAARYQVPVILMHMKGTPETMQADPVYDDLIQEISDYLAARAQYAMSKGIEKTNIILDPGIGFGKTVHHNLVLIQCLETIVALGFPVLMGPSRKSFIRTLLHLNRDTDDPDSAEQIETGTLAAVGACLAQGAHIIRVHDVPRAAAFTRIFDAVRNA
ncbi:MAG: dihydropteroate synthase [Desulfotignum sp.]|nr:dihydropteroate synthase [Desulfotignum sp.]MCF8087443.1 dihydropteroate synthase [Desulfotignum sp.]MCF8137614.1 dihydropteroate synthase [Desulfotignum sp.]